MILLLLSCFPDLTPGEGITDNPFHDYDGDGYSAFDADCDDTLSQVFPGAVELPDNLDNDCDDLIDEGLDTGDTGPGDDRDGDGYPADQDCNDDIASINPGAEEVPGNSIDEDCDGRACERPLALQGSYLLSDFAWSLDPDDGTGRRDLTAGDVDGDGSPEVVLGSPDEAGGGAIYLLRAADLDQGLVAAHRIGAGEAGGFGEDVLAADLDGDGQVELVVLARDGADNSELRVFSDPWAASSGDDGVLTDPGDLGRFTDWIVVSDLDGDGELELIICTEKDGNHAVVVVPGPALLQGGAIDELASAVLYASDQDVAQYLAVGDLDGDGVDELVVGGRTVGEDARVWVLFEPPHDGTLNDQAKAIKGLGEFVAADGDFDGDGIDDLLMSLDWAGDYEGKVWLFSGPGLASSAPVPLWVMEAHDNERLGRGLSLGYDVDGVPTALLGARSADRIYAVRGPHEGVLGLDDADVVFVGEDGDNSGGTITVLPDLNNDCLPELGIASTNGPAVWVLPGLVAPE